MRCEDRSDFSCLVANGSYYQSQLYRSTRKPLSLTDLALRSAVSARDFWATRLAPNRHRMVLLLVLATLLAIPQLRELTLSAMADAYLQVSVFVAATLALFYGAERLLKVDLGAWMARNVTWQPLIAALLGASPGCGGAIIVVTQFARGHASFGALISVLVATMGDAAFLLIARDPVSAAIVIGISTVAGTLSGMLVDRIHGRDFMRPKQTGALPEGLVPTVAFVPAIGRRLWFALLVPGAVVGAMMALQIEPDALFGFEVTLWLGAFGAGLSVLLWALSRGSPHAISGTQIGTRVIADTNFVTAWVVMAFLAYELTVHLFGIDVGTLFQAWAPLMPLAGVLVGFIPGCGPQIVVTSLYLAGAIPLSAQLANAIANDGDALFPAIALAPRAALLATIYSAIPALLVGYGWFMLFE